MLDYRVAVLSDDKSSTTLTIDVTGNTIPEMNTATKLLHSMRTNPLDWRIEQLQTVAKQHGLDWRQEGTSHCVFVRADGKTLPVPSRRPIKAVYVKKFVALVKGD